MSPSSFRRVLVEHGLTLPQPQPRSRSERRPWPDWLVWAPNRIWIWDVTHFTRARRVCFAIVDVVSRKWIDTLVSVEETATQVQVIFERSLEIEGLLDLLTDERLDLDPERPAPIDPARRERQRAADDRRSNPRVHGADGHRPAPRPPAHFDRSGLDRVVLQPHQKRVAAPGDHHRSCHT